jgi:DNA-binding transcriptional MerR regulator
LESKAPDAFRTISEVADDLDLPQHVLRFWETRFRDIKPMKRGGGRRYYRPDDVDLLRGIRHLLYGEGYTIRGVQRILREQGAKFVQAVWQEGAPQPPHGAREEDEFTEEVASAVMLDEESGRFGLLIGRDLNERAEIASTRQDPLLRGAPVPRLDADDRLIPAKGDLDTPSTRARPIPSGPGGRLTRDDLQMLHTILHDLTECRKLLVAEVDHIG